MTETSKDIGKCNGTELCHLPSSVGGNENKRMVTNTPVSVQEGQFRQRVDFIFHTLSSQARGPSDTELVGTGTRARHFLRLPAGGEGSPDTLRALLLRGPGKEDGARGGLTSPRRGSRTPQAKLAMSPVPDRAWPHSTGLRPGAGAPATGEGGGRRETLPALSFHIMCCSRNRILLKFQTEMFICSVLERVLLRTF